MRILAIETSTPCGTVALLDRKGGIEDEREFTSHRAHNAKIFEPLEELRQLYPAAVDLVVIGSGPGSYSGIRVGIAVANGIAMADGCPAIAVPSIAALELPAGEDTGDYDVVGDARRGSFFHTRIRDHRLLTTEGILMDESAFQTSIEAATHKIFTMDENPPHPRSQKSRPRASILAALADAMSAEEIDALSKHPLQPIYLRAPFTTKAKKRPFTRSD